MEKIIIKDIPELIDLEENEVIEINDVEEIELEEKKEVPEVIEIEPEPEKGPEVKIIEKETIVKSLP